MEALWRPLHERSGELRSTMEKRLGVLHQTTADFTRVAADFVEQERRIQEALNRHSGSMDKVPAQLVEMSERIDGARQALTASIGQVPDALQRLSENLKNVTAISGKMQEISDKAGLFHDAADTLEKLATRASLIKERSQLLKEARGDLDSLREDIRALTEQIPEVKQNLQIVTGTSVDSDTVPGGRRSDLFGLIEQLVGSCQQLQKQGDDLTHVQAQLNEALPDIKEGAAFVEQIKALLDDALNARDSQLQAIKQDRKQIEKEHKRLRDWAMELDGERRRAARELSETAAKTNENIARREREVSERASQASEKMEQSQRLQGEAELMLGKANAIWPAFMRNGAGDLADLHRRLAADLDPDSSARREAGRVLGALLIVESLQQDDKAAARAIFDLSCGLCDYTDRVEGDDERLSSALRELADEYGRRFRVKIHVVEPGERLNDNMMHRCSGKGETVQRAGSWFVSHGRQRFLADVVT